MEKICQVCGKRPRIGFSISHSHIRTKRQWLPNLQRVKTLVGGRIVKLNVCTRCLRAGKVKRAV